MLELGPAMGGRAGQFGLLDLDVVLFSFGLICAKS